NAYGEIRQSVAGSVDCGYSIRARTVMAIANTARKLSEVINSAQFCRLENQIIVSVAVKFGESWRHSKHGGNRLTETRPSGRVPFRHQICTLPKHQILHPP